MDIPDGSILFVNKRELDQRRAQYPRCIVAPHYNVVAGMAWVLEKSGARRTVDLDGGGRENRCPTCGQSLPVAVRGDASRDCGGEGVSEGAR